MKPEDNPYRPGAGITPVTFAGRDQELEQAQIVLHSLTKGNLQRSFFYYGLRGVGKTVLLNEIQKYLADLDILWEHIEISEHDNFKKVIAETLRSVLLTLNRISAGKEFIKKALGILKAFSLTVEGVEFKIEVNALTGTADSGNFQRDLTDLFEATGSAAKLSSRPVILFFDEVQYLNDYDFEALIGAIHRIYQLGFPLLIFGAGLPQILRLAGDAKSYSERLFEFKPLDYLDYTNAKKALIGPANECLQYKEDSLKEIYKITEGYTYFLQEMGKHIWELADQSIISLQMVKKATPLFYKSLDASFYKVRYDRSTNSQKKFMHAMASLRNSPYPLGEIAKKMGVQTKSLGPTRAELISKGFIYSPEYGKLSFTVPQFEKYLKRQDTISFNKKKKSIK